MESEESALGNGRPGEADGLRQQEQQTHTGLGSFQPGEFGISLRTKYGVPGKENLHN